MIERAELKKLIDEAVACSHEVADDHGIQHCNCFREKFVSRLIEMGYKSPYVDKH